MTCFVLCMPCVRAFVCVLCHMYVRIWYILSSVCVICIGEIGLIFGEPRTASLRATQHSEFAILNFDDFVDVRIHY